jgi:hypothetical protein
MKKNELTNIGTSKNNTEEVFTMPTEDGLVKYIERVVEEHNFEGFEVVRSELFSKANCPAVTLKGGKIMFNIKAIRKLDGCRYIQMLMNPKENQMIARPCKEDEKDYLQWSKINKHGKLETRPITGRAFCDLVFKQMEWESDGTYKILGTLEIDKRNKKIFIFELNNAEQYVRLAMPTEDNPNRYQRVPLAPAHYQGRYGDLYEERKEKKIETFEDIPEGFIRITIPSSTSKKSKADITKESKSNSDQKKKGDK